MFDLIGRMLQYEPTQRISLQEALRHPFFDKLPDEYKLHLEDKQDNRRSLNDDDQSKNDLRERSHSISR